MSAKTPIASDLVLNYEKTKKLVKLHIEAQKPILIHGKPGIGKSDMLREIARETGRQFIDIRLSLYEPVDLKGYPYLKETGLVDQSGEKALAFAMSEEFPWEDSDPDSTAIILFDEINGAMPSTQLAMYQLILDRAIGSKKLAKGVSLVAAGNRESDKGATFPMPKPLENRFSHVELEPSFDDWINWAITTGVHVEIVGYLAKNEGKLNTFDPSKSSRAFATPRSWHRASDMLKLVGEGDTDTIYNVMSANIGTPLASEFMAFRKIASEVPSAKEILSGKAPKLKKAGADIAYMLMTNCLYKLNEINQQAKNEGKAESDELMTGINNFFAYLVENKDMLGKEFLVLPISIGFKNYQLPMNKKRAPAISEVMAEVGDLLKDALQN